MKKNCYFKLSFIELMSIKVMLIEEETYDSFFDIDWINLNNIDNNIL